MKTPTVEELRDRADAAKAEDSAARTALLEAESAYTKATLNGSGLDEVSQARAHKILVDARSRVSRATDRSRVVQAALDELRAQKTSAEKERIERQRAAARQEARESWQDAIAMVQDAVDDLVERLDICERRGLMYREAIGAVPAVEEQTLLWNPHVLERYAQLYVFAKSGGRLRMAAASQSPFQLAQGPDLRARCRENIQRIAALGRVREPPPPEAA